MTQKGHVESSSRLRSSGICSRNSVRRISGGPGLRVASTAAVAPAVGRPGPLFYPFPLTGPDVLEQN